jgi:hypothetical protein
VSTERVREVTNTAKMRLQMRKGAGGFGLIREEEWLTRLRL